LRLGFVREFVAGPAVRQQDAAVHHPHAHFDGCP
jgi:hypothetical protein